MRTHARSKAPLAVLSLTVAIVAAPLLSVAPASAAARRSAPATADNFARLRACESGGNYEARTRNRYFGAYQFAGTTWRALGFEGMPHEASPEMQDDAASQLQARYGWGQWPGCSRRLGLR
ncbi:MAG: transglycosylase family protein [Acidimicrobiales bacterium]